MKCNLSLLLVLLLAAVCLCAQPQKQVIISYPHDTPSSVVQEAMAAIKEAGGVIEHEYSLIKGFVAKAPATILETVQALGSSNGILIEEDQQVHAQDT